MPQVTQLKPGPLACARSLCKQLETGWSARKSAKTNVTWTWLNWNQRLRDNMPGRDLCPSHIFGPTQQRDIALMTGASRGIGGDLEEFLSYSKHNTVRARDGRCCKFQFGLGAVLPNSLVRGEEVSLEFSVGVGKPTLTLSAIVRYTNGFRASNSPT
jgi:hypothetical protein